MRAAPAIATFSILLWTGPSSPLRAALQQPAAAIEGLVLGGAGEPVHGAEVRLINARTGSLAGALFSQSTVVATDTTGRFSLTSVSAGTYRIYATARGFAQQEYGQTSPNVSGKPISISSGETL